MQTGFVEKTNYLLNEKNILSLKVIRTCLNPIFTILQDSLERKIIPVFLSSFVQKKVITCLLSNVLLY